MASRFPLRSPGFLGAVALANAGGVIAYLPLLTLLLPLKVEGLSATGRWRAAAGDGRGWRAAWRRPRRAMAG
ncbi:hypothetical protein WR25_08056 [Diploscapter pachys]|uniref:Major facilitator superfamily (MFS) profile domain-containing protein n=1 Tax=Diploscapter pachys TaxID=2018661 RepID=A0A2A2K0C2_9BILA|nr:hypothetical protein WR25_08056 [Diploscapter pachys]